MVVFLRKLILFSLLGASIILAGIVFYNPHPCISPLRYSIGQVDSQFSIGTSTFRDLVAEAQEPWEEAAERELFIYDQDATYSVNLIYDERQQRTHQTEEIQEELSDLEDSRQKVLAEYERLKRQAEAARDEFEQQNAEYQQQLSEYNERVETWNERGGAPPDKAEELDQQRAELDAISDDLEEQRERVLALADRLQEVADEQNDIVQQLRSTASTYRERYDEEREFEQGTFTGNEINIYQYQELSDLRLVLVHEFGHALGIEHVDDPTGVMHYLMGEQSLHPVELTAADKQALAEVCKDASYFRW